MSLKSLDAIAWIRQESAIGLSYWSGVASFEATSTGSVSTIVSSTLASYVNSDDDLAGLLVEVIYSGDAPGGESGSPLRRRVIGYDYSADTLMIEALPFSTADGDAFALLDPPNPYWAEATGGSATQVIDPDRNEADDYWIGAAEKGGPYMQVLRADSVNSVLNARISDFSTATGAATVALGASTVIGDLYEAWEWPEVFSGAPLTWSQPRVDRNPVTGSMGRPRGSAGLREGSGTIELAFRGPGRSRIGDAAECDTPFGAVMAATAAPADCVVSTGSSTSLATTQSGSPVAGSMYCTEGGDVFYASSVAGDNITPSPTMRYSPKNGQPLYGLRRYTPDTALNYALAFKQWWGKEQVDYLWGCVPNIQLGGARGEYLKITMPMQVADGYRVYLDESNAAYSRPINPKTSTITPRVLGDCRCNIDGTEYEMRNFNIDLGLDIQQHTNLAAPNSTDGFSLVSDNVTGTVDIWMETDARLTTQKWLMGKPMTLLVQAGEHPGEPGILAFWAYEIEVTACDGAEDAGFHTVSVQWRVTEDSTTSLHRWAIGVG